MSLTASETRTRTPRHATTPPPDQPADRSTRRSVVIRGVLFVANCVLLITAAANLHRLGEWADRWGQIPVYLGFFFLMSIAGRWFWTGADAILARVVGNQ